VNGTPISEDAVAMWASRMEPAIQRLGATFFEATTCMAFADFAARQVDIAVIEVGLGGRLDSTNVIEPLVSGVTRIAWDHMKYLGDTLTAIAREKAGIAKRGVPFVIGETQPDLVAVLESVSRNEGATPVLVSPDLRYTGPLGLAGSHQQRNAAVAKAMLDALPATFRPARDGVQTAFRSARLAGRFDRRGKWVFDVAHNPDGMRALVAAIAETGLPRPIHALVSILGDKEWPEMLVILDSAIDRGVLTMAPTAAGRGWDLRWLRDWLQRSDRPPAQASWSLVPDFGDALTQVQQGAGTVLVTGSFHTVGDVMEALGMAPIA
jgi:dihydrofolate synthase/folylpolyglutamate synthase